jgi:hypothetical protein
MDYDRLGIVLAHAAKQSRRSHDETSSCHCVHVGLAGIGLCALVMTEARIERLLVEEGIIALTILVLFIVTKPRKPSNPQHPVPSSEPPHLMRGIKSRQSADGF